MSPLLLLAPDDDVVRTLFWLGVLLLPVIGRALRALREKAERGEQGRGTDLDRDASRRAEQRRLEEEGGDLWRRLARGELPEAPPVRPVPEARRVGAPPRRRPVVPAERVERTGVEDLEAPRPLSVLGEVSEPGEASEESLEAASQETEAAPVPLDSLSAQPAAAVEPARARRSRLIATRADLRRAVVMSEILALPVGLRAPEVR